MFAFEVFKRKAAGTKRTTSKDLKRARKEKKRKNNFWSVDSLVLEPSLLQKEPLHCWAPALVSRRSEDRLLTIDALLY